MTTGIELIAMERQRQIEKEGWTAEHDAAHERGELANAAAYYAMTDETIDFINNEWGNDMHLHIWPFGLKWLKRTPKNRMRDLQKAGALIAAEIDRLSKKEPTELEFLKSKGLIKEGFTDFIITGSFGKIELTALLKDYKTEQISLIDVTQPRELLEWLSSETSFQIEKNEISEILADWKFYKSNCGKDKNDIQGNDFIADVSNRKELLLDFAEYMDSENDILVPSWAVDNYLNSK